MRFLRRHWESDERARLPMTSLIDVVFLLLIYFMVTASMTAREGDLSSALRAQREGGGSAADLQPQIVDVQRSDGGAVQFRIGEHIADSRQGLTAILAQLQAEHGVFIRVAGDVPVDAAAAAMQAAKDAGFQKVTYVPRR